MSTEAPARVNVAANLGGMTLKSLLENPTVLKPPPEPNQNEKDQKQLDWSKDVDPTLIASAFLGPNLWNKTIAADSDDFKDFKLEYMDLDEFLAENGIPVNHENDHHSASLPTTSQTVMQHSPPPTYTTMTTMQPAMAYGQHPRSPPMDLNKRKHSYHHPGNIPIQMTPPIMMLPGIHLPMSRHELATINGHHKDRTGPWDSHKARAEAPYVSMASVYQRILYRLDGETDQPVPMLEQRFYEPKTGCPAPNFKYGSHKLFLHKSNGDTLCCENVDSQHVDGKQFHGEKRRPPPLIQKLPSGHLHISDVRSIADPKLPPCELMPRGEIDIKPLVSSLLPRMDHKQQNIAHDSTRPVTEQAEHEQAPDKLSSVYVSPSAPLRTPSRSSYYSTEAWSDADSAEPEDLTLSSTSGGHYRQQLSPTPGVSPPPHLTAEDVIPKVDISLDPGDLALASIPGAKEDFDPRKRAFTDDELKPQPMMKKSKKVYVPTDLKDDRYWQRRQKNNMAAKRSRDARRVKENQIAMRASFLEKENNALKEELLKVKEENAYLKKKLTKYEP
ncbi:uncharacterized protein LOC144917383 isoform X2 [Branchiostoma floridae x Branchiostoma belcheri]